MTIISTLIYFNFQTDLQIKRSPIFISFRLNKNKRYIKILNLKIEIKLEDLVFLENFIDSTFRFTHLSFS